MYLVACYAYLLIALVYSSEVQGAYPSVPAKVAFYDFDKTTTTYSFGPIVRDVCNATAMEAGTLCGATSGEMATALATLSDDEVKAAFGGQERIDTLAAHWTAVKGDDSTIDNIFILSTSWMPVPAAEWKDMIVKTFERIGLSDIFDADNVLTLDDPGPGISADKGAVAKAKLDVLSLTAAQCINVDDSQGNIDSEAGQCTAEWDPPCCDNDACDDLPRARTCDTLQVIPREGMSGADLDFMLSRGGETPIIIECADDPSNNPTITPTTTTEDNKGGVAYKNDFLCFVFVFCVFMLR